MFLGLPNLIIEIKHSKIQRREVLFVFSPARYHLSHACLLIYDYFSNSKTKKINIFRYQIVTSIKVPQKAAITIIFKDKESLFENLRLLRLSLFPILIQFLFNFTRFSVICNFPLNMR